MERAGVHIPLILRNVSLQVVNTSPSQIASPMFIFSLPFFVDILCLPLGVVRSFKLTREYLLNSPLPLCVEYAQRSVCFVNKQVP